MPENGLKRKNPRLKRRGNKEKEKAPLAMTYSRGGSPPNYHRR